MQYLVKRWWLILLLLLMGGAMGGLLYKLQKPKYEAVCTFILEEKQAGIGGLSSIASQFGFDFGSLSGGSIFAGDNILDIMKSKQIIRNVLLTKVDSSQGPASPSLADLFLDFSGWKEKWKGDGKAGVVNFFDNRPGSTLTLVQDSVLSLIQDNLMKKALQVERLNKKGSIVSVAVVAPNQTFAKLFSNRIVDASRSFYITVKTNTTQQSVNRLERKADSLLVLLNRRSYEAATSVVLDVNPALRSASVPVELKQRDKAILGTLYAEVVKNLELSRLTLSEQTPVIFILDRASFPLEDKRLKLMILVPLFSIGLTLIVVMILGLKQLFPTARVPVQSPTV
jgi:hypothetical protein